MSAEPASGVIDSCVHHRWPSQSAVQRYMPEGWREYLGEPGSLPGGRGQVRAIAGFPFFNPLGETCLAAGEENVASSAAGILAAHVAPNSIDRAILSFDHLRFAAAVPNQYLAHELCRAANDWTAEEWLAEANELFAYALVPNQVPEQGARELRRAGRHPHVVGALMGANGVGKPFGHPLYDPIYEACADLALPAVIHIGADAPAEATTHTGAAGLPSSFTEYSVTATVPLMTHLASMIVQGLFVKFPSLKVYLIGANPLLLHFTLWRLDSVWRTQRREVPWVTRFPSEYFRDHVYVSTWPPAGAPSPEQLERALRALDEPDGFLCYSSGFPDWRSSTPAQAAASMPVAWRDRVFRENAQELFRWEQPVRPTLSATSGAQSVVGDMQIGGLQADDKRRWA